LRNKKEVEVFCHGSINYLVALIPRISTHQLLHHKLAMSTTSTPVELLSQKRHPLEHLSKIFSSFCNPENEANTATEDDENEDGLQSQETIPTPEYSSRDPIVASSKSIVVQDFEGEVETQLEILPSSHNSSSSSVVVVVNPETTQSPVTNIRLEDCKPEGILKTDKDETKKKTAVVVDSGRGHRVSRIIETAVFTILVVCATILALQRLGHETGINFNPSSPSTSIKFDMRMDEIVKPVDVEVAAINVTTTTNDIENGAAPGIDDAVAGAEPVEQEVTPDIAEEKETPQYVSSESSIIEEAIQYEASDEDNSSPGENEEEDFQITEDSGDTNGEEL
jgi:hypothetical protein